MLNILADVFCMGGCLVSTHALSRQTCDFEWAKKKQINNCCTRCEELDSSDQGLVLGG